MRSVIILLTASCYRPQPQNCAFTCSANEECPNGLGCDTDGFCRSDGSLPCIDAPATPPCDVNARFGPPQRLAGLLDGDSLGQMSPDELTAYLAVMQATTDYDLFVVTRGSTSEAFSGRTPLSVNTPAREVEPAIDADGLTLLFSRLNPTEFDVFVATRTSTVAVFGAASLVAGNINEPYFDGNPYLTKNALYFGSSRIAGIVDLYRAPRQGGGFGDPQLLTELDAPENQSRPVVTADELAIYFASQRTSPGVPQGATDIFLATRPSITVPFGNLRQVDELSTSTFEIPSFASADHCRLYFTQLVGGVQAVFVASRPPP